MTHHKVTKKIFNIKYLNHLIELHGISLTKLEQQTGISHSTMSLLTRGLSTRPHIDTVSILAKYFHVKIADFYKASNTQLLTSNSDNSKIPEVLDELMHRNGIMNTSQLGKASKIPVPTIDRILSRSTKSPNHNTLTALAKFFKVNIAQLKGIKPLETQESPIIKYPTCKIPLINIHDVGLWLDTFNNNLIISHVESDISDATSRNLFAIMNKTLHKISTYILDPNIAPITNDITIINHDEQNNIVMCTDKSFKTLDYKDLTIPTQYKLFGSVIQEFHTRIAIK